MLSNQIQKYWIYWRNGVGRNFWEHCDFKKKWRQIHTHSCRYVNNRAVKKIREIIEFSWDHNLQILPLIF